MASIELHELTKHYKQAHTIVRAVDGITLTVDAGEFISIVGRSGSGKTTTLDLLGLLLRPTSGQVLLDGVDTGKLQFRGRALYGNHHRRRADCTHRRRPVRDQHHADGRHRAGA